MEFQELMENLKARGFAAQYFETAEEAKAYLESLKTARTEKTT